MQQLQGAAAANPGVANWVGAVRGAWALGGDYWNAHDPQADGAPTALGAMVGWDASPAETTLQVSGIGWAGRRFSSVYGSVLVDGVYSSVCLSDLSTHTSYQTSEIDS